MIHFQQIICLLSVVPVVYFGFVNDCQSWGKRIQDVVDISSLAKGKPLKMDFLERVVMIPLYAPAGKRAKFKQCYVCRSYAEGEFYPHCPKDGDVNPQITWKENCTGHCFSRTDDLDDKLVYRGCSDSQWGLPDPLPPDGCYTYYLEVWCICNKNLCNGVAIGEGKVEFDAHIPKEVKKESSTSTLNRCTVLSFVTVLLLILIL